MPRMRHPQRRSAVLGMRDQAVSLRTGAERPSVALLLPRETSDPARTLARHREGEILKLTTQLTAVLCVAIIGGVGMVGFLAHAGWSEGGIAGMVTGILTAVGSLILVVRNQVKSSQQLDELARSVGAGQRTIIEQTNGKNAAEIDVIAEAAAMKVAQMYRGGRL